MMARVFHILVLVVCVGVLAGACLFTVDDLGVWLFGFKWRIHCLLDSLFGVKCAFCGMTRSFTTLGDGDPGGAFEHHPLGPLVFLFVVFQIPYRIYVTMVRPARLQKWPGKVHAGYAAAVLTAIFVNWLIYLGGRLL